MVPRLQGTPRELELPDDLHMQSVIAHTLHRTSARELPFDWKKSLQMPIQADQMVDLNIQNR